MFIQTRSGDYINTDHVAIISPQDLTKEQRKKLLRGEVRCHIIFSDDEHRNDSVWQDDLDQLGSTVIRAEPGYTLLRAWDEGYVSREPIVAWRIHSNGISPVALDDDSFEDEEGAILYPDGRVVSPGDRSWDNEEEWLPDAQKRREEYVAKRRDKGTP